MNIYIYLVVFLSLGIYSTKAQVSDYGSPPAVTSKLTNWMPTKPNGTSVGSAAASGEDWYYDHKIRMNGTTPIGYVYVGYTMYRDYPLVQSANNIPVSYVDADTWNLRDPLHPLIDVYPTLYLTDLNLQVTNSYVFNFRANLNKVIQTADGNFVAVGICRGNETVDAAHQLIEYNPCASCVPHTYTPSNVTTNCPYADKLLVVKINPSGTVLWKGMFGVETYGTCEAIKSGGEGFDLAETNDGSIIVVGLLDKPGSNPSDPNVKYNAILKISSSGKYLDGKYLSKCGQADKSPNAMSIVKHKSGSVESFFVGASIELSASTQQATLQKFDANLNSYWAQKPFGPNNLYARITDLCLNTKGEVIVPIINMTRVLYAAGEGSIKIVKVDVNGNKLWESPDGSVGNVKAFDLKLGSTGTADGGFALVSTAQKTQLGYPGTYNGINFYENNDLARRSTWNTDAIVIKYNSNNLKDWVKVFDSETPTPAGTAPDILSSPVCAAGSGSNCNYAWTYSPVNYNYDLKRQECVYSIVQAPDGGFVIAGNASANLDDNYMAKLAPENTNCNSAIIVNQNITAPITYTSASTISTSQTVNVSANINVTFQAKNSVKLSPGFKATYGSVFSAVTDNTILCTPDYSRIAGVRLADNSINSASEETEMLDEIRIQPNPNAGRFNLVINPASEATLLQIYVHDNLGRIIYTHQVSQPGKLDTEINLPDVAKGIYYVKIISTSKSYCEKVAIE